MRLLPILLALASTAAVLPTTGAAQGGRPVPAEVRRLLRDASILEARGDLPAAEERLRQALAVDPASVPAVFAVERVLRAQGRVGDLLPLLDTYFEHASDPSAFRALELRVLVELDSLTAFEEAATEWLDLVPPEPEAFREVARLRARVGGPDAGLRTLAEGRAVLGDPRAFALETGDLLLESGGPDEAFAAWIGHLGPNGEGASAVLSRLSAHQEVLGRERLAIGLTGLVEGDPPVARLRAAIELAVGLGLESEALRAARLWYAEAPEEERRPYLDELTRTLEGPGNRELRLWVYERLREHLRDEGEAWYVDRLLASAALAAGDSLRALEARRRLAGTFPAGSAERRRELAAYIELEALVGDVDEARRRLDEMRREFPDAPELDHLATQLSSRLRTSGATGAARDALQGVTGPRSTYERALLLLQEGRVDDARLGLLEAAVGLAGDEANRAIRLALLLKEADSVSIPHVTRLLAADSVDALAQVVGALLEDLPSLPVGDRPPLLAFTAGIADDFGEEELSASLRERLIAGHPEAAEVPEAILLLARYRGRTQEGRPEAIALLERLIVERPGSPHVPQARRLLEALRRGG